MENGINAVDIPEVGGEVSGGPVVVEEDTVQLIAFTVEDEIFGVDIMAVREIRAWTETTPLPNTPSFVRGVINLRGIIVPIFDFMDRLGRGLTEATETHVVIVLGVEGRTVGLLVDAVSDILTIPETAIRPVPDTGKAVGEVFVTGLAEVDDKMIAMISQERICCREAINVPGMGGDV